MEEVDLTLRGEQRMTPEEELEIECLCMEDVMCPYRIKLIKLNEAYKRLKENTKFEGDLGKGRKK